MAAPILRVYRTLLKTGKRLDKHWPLRVFVNDLAFIEPLAAHIRNAKSVDSGSLLSDMYLSRKSVEGCVKQLFHYYREECALSSDGASDTHALMHALSAAKAFNDANELAEFCGYNYEEIEALPPNECVPCRQSAVILEALRRDPSLDRRIDVACGYLEFHISATDSFDEKISYLKKSIEAYPTADAFAALSWACYLRGRELGDSLTESFSTESFSKPTFSKPTFSKPKSGSTSKVALMTNATGIDPANVADERQSHEHKPFDEGELQLIPEDESKIASFEDGLKLAKVWAQKALLLDDSLGQPHNDIALCLIAERHPEHHREAIVEHFETAIKSERYSKREASLRRLGRFYMSFLEHRNALRSFASSLMFEDALEQNVQIYESCRKLLPLVAAEMGRKGRGVRSHVGFGSTFKSQQ